MRRLTILRSPFWESINVWDTVSKDAKALCDLLRNATDEAFQKELIHILNIARLWYIQLTPILGVIGGGNWGGPQPGVDDPPEEDPPEPARITVPQYQAAQAVLHLIPNMRAETTNLHYDGIPPDDFNWLHVERALNGTIVGRLWTEVADLANVAQIMMIRITTSVFLAEDLLNTPFYDLFDAFGDAWNDYYDAMLE